ncbi:transposase [Amycolatopsis sp. NPDC024027]|uniref:IS110 family transposase n=1 Tax=Amycolatopsis sp. NPDC024027 TaxID=3154327 RepID=UPI0033D0688A
MTSAPSRAHDPGGGVTGSGMRPTGWWPCPCQRSVDATLPNSEPKLRALFDKLAGHGPLLVVVDQPATIGAIAGRGRPRRRAPGGLPARTGDAPHRRPQPRPHETDARDAFVIADTARSLPHTLRPVDVGPGTAAADTVLPRLADSLKTILLQRKQVAEPVEGIPDAHPLAGILTSMPGIGVRTAARILLEVGGHPKLRHQHQRRAPGPHRQPPAQTRVLPRRVRSAVRPDQRLDNHCETAWAAWWSLSGWSGGAG